ncbi:MAG: Uma2 family endonuclease [Acidobacteria bacterium]|nr:Uma2 family endonuclease [Acidobacteriota bacterium]
MTPDEFWEFCSKNRKLRAELTKDGEVIIMPPTGYESSEENVELIIQLGTWAKTDGTGKVTESSGAFILPDGSTKAPDAAWIKKERLEKFTAEERKKFLSLVPDFVIELCSPSDSLSEQQTKMKDWVENGTRLGWLIDPKHRKAYIYRADGSVEVLDDPKTISGEDILPGFELDMSQIW